MQISDLPLYLSLFMSLYMLTLFYIAFFEELEAESERKKDKIKYPNVAVIVPAYNEEDTIVGTVDSLLDLDYPKEKLRIYVVDDGSKDKTWQVLQKYASNEQVKLLRKENGGKASAMNYAFNRLDKNTELVGILDADSFVKSDALREVIRKFSESDEYMAVTPAIKIWNPNKIIRFLQNAEYNLSIWLRKAFDNLGTIFIIPGPFSFYRKKALEKAGPWRHAHGTEDLEMGLRFQELGFKVANTTKAVVYTVSPDSAFKLYKQRLRWTYGFLNNALDYKHLFFRSSNKALALFMLPSSVLSIALAIYVFFYGIYTLLIRIYDKYLLWQNVGFEFKLSTPDLFFVHINFISWLAIVVIAAAVFASYAGDRASNDPNLRVKDLLTYLALYGFLAPWWLFVSIVKTLRRSEVKWVKVNR